MGTTSEKLQMLLRTKERQKAYLQQKYPLLDFDTIPFRAYLDLFQGRSYVPGLVAAWKTYGKRNDDADRDDLYDYSGNGRDIELFNFAFSGMSGYGGYPQDMSHFSRLNAGVNIETTGTSITITTLAEGGGRSAFMPVSYYSKRAMKLKVTSSIALTSSRIIVYNKTGWTVAYSQNLTVNGVTDVNVIPDEYLTDEYEGNIYLAFSGNNNPVGSTITVELLPDYPGALVSDGIDDYGKCIKDFALTDDYTVAAIRKVISGNSSAVVSKGSASGAFIFDATSDNTMTNAWSYGASTTKNNFPALFSYQTKGSYNGSAISSGVEEDDDKDVLWLFTHNLNRFSQVALYDVRIYDHSLTAEELQTVKDEMLSDFENATGGGITDITYVADWDGKGRSNDEEADVRSQWIDKATGKVINLSNYAYSQMSGWNGYLFDWSSGWNTDYANLIVTKEYGKTKVRFSGLENLPKTTVTLLYRMDANIPASSKIRLRISGLEATERFTLVDKTNSSVIVSRYGDGILEYTPEVVLTYPRLSVALNSLANREITIEQLPLYPGALVSDGVDDRIRAEEALGEVGTVLIHWKNIGLPVSHYLYNTGWDEDAGRLYCWNTQGNIACGTPHMQMDGHPIMIYHRSPLVSTVPLNNTAGENNCPIFRLIFVREQLDAAQLEFLKWKVEKEYRDWCKENGYEYAITEMLNN